MSCNNNNLSITIIKGDTCQKNVTIKTGKLRIIDSVYFSSEKLGFSQKLRYDEDIGKYIFYLSPQETSEMNTYYGDFDITIKFSDNDIRTALYRGYIEVLEKTNVVDYGS